MQLAKYDHVLGRWRQEKCNVLSEVKYGGDIELDLITFTVLCVYRVFGT